MQAINRDTHRHMPIVTRVWLPDALLLAAIGLAFILIGLLVPQIDTGSLTAMVIVGLPSWFVGMRLYRRIHAFSKRVRDADGKLCTHCGYDMSGVASPAVCTECAKPYLHDDARTRWSDTFLVQYNKARTTNMNVGD